MSDRPIDFSSLDPARHRDAWDHRITTIVQTAVAARLERENLLAYVLRYSGPALAVAAAIALVSWIFAMQTHYSPSTFSAKTAATELLEWASKDAVPSTSEVLASFGANP